MTKIYIFYPKSPKKLTKPEMLKVTTDGLLNLENTVRSYIVDFNSNSSIRAFDNSAEYTHDTCSWIDFYQN